MARPSSGSSLPLDEPVALHQRTIGVIVCLLNRARRAISPIRSPSSSKSGMSTEPYEGRTSG